MMRWSALHALDAMVVLFSLVTCTTPFLQPAAAQVMGEIIGPGATSYPIAIPPLQEVGGRQDDTAVRFADILSHDLQLSGYFQVLDRQGYIDDPQTSPTTGDQIEFHNWSVIGARALVKGTLERTADDIVVEVRLFDVPGRKQLAGKRYSARARDFSRIAQRFADEVLLVFTGIRGPFDSRIAFVSGRSGGMKELYFMTFDGLAPTRLTAFRSIIASPAWSKDARRILFTSYQRGHPGLYELDVAERHPRYVAEAGPLYAGGAWSPDGSLIAVTVEMGGNPEIVLLYPDGRTARRLTKNPAIDVSPTWSPDGREIAFCSDRAGGPQIFVARVATGDVRRITYSGSYNTSPAWSPVGDEIAYTRRVTGRFQIFTVDARGENGAAITNDPGDNEDPSWSPDGRYLVFSSTRAGRSHLFMVDRRGRIRKQLTHGEGSDSSADWSPRLE
jgi:TolB protein